MNQYYYRLLVNTCHKSPMCECVNHCNVLCICDLIPVTPTTVKSTWWLLMAWHHVSARPFAAISVVIILCIGWVSNQCLTETSWHNDPSKSETPETLFSMWLRRKLNVRFKSGARFTSKVTDSKYCTNLTAEGCVLLVTPLEFYFIGFVNAHLPGCFCPWTFRLNIGLNTSPSDSFVSYLNSHLGYSAGEFQALQLIVLAVFGAVD